MVHGAREAIVVFIVLVEVEGSFRNTGRIVGGVDVWHNLKLGREVFGVRSRCDRCRGEWCRRRFARRLGGFEVKGDSDGSEERRGRRRE